MSVENVSVFGLTWYRSLVTTADGDPDRNQATGRRSDFEWIDRFEFGSI